MTAAQALEFIHQSNDAETLISGLSLVVASASRVLEASPEQIERLRQLVSAVDSTVVKLERKMR